MTERNTGLPEFAFPSTFVSLTEKEQVHKWGMTLRDYFAAKAMEGLLSSTKTADEKVIAEDAYNMADAMLEARKT